MVTDYIREFVKQECKKSQLTMDLYENHILLVAEYGERLAKLLGADSLVVELASYLHDFSPVHNFDHKNDHAIKNPKLIQELLTRFKFSDSVIKEVTETIMANSRPINEKASIEVICLSNAEAMSQLAKPVFWIFYNDGTGQKPYKECVKSYVDWMEANWKTMISEARDMMAEEYDFLKKLFSL